jgi:hypothetical protein
MTTNQVIAELQKIVQLNPERGEQECFIYSMIAEEPETISMIDSTISDRVDINGTEPQEA